MGGEYLNNLLPSNPIHTLHVHSNHYSGRSRHDTPSSLQLWGMCDDGGLAAEPEAENAALRSQSAWWGEPWGDPKVDSTSEDGGHRRYMAPTVQGEY